MNISSLTNAELDRMIAEKRGWECIYCECGCDRFHWITPDGSRGELPSFTTDPRYAMELAKEMQEKGMHVRIRLDPVTRRTFVEIEKSGYPTKYSVADETERAIAEEWMLYNKKEIEGGVIK